jgi:hypothetical protein
LYPKRCPGEVAASRSAVTSSKGCDVVSVPEEAGWILDEYDAERYWANVSYRGGTDHESDPLATAKGECWVWRTVNVGYPKFLWKFGRWETASRVAFKDWGGKLTDEQEIDHLCRNTRCVNPSHLEAKCPKGHEYTPENTRLQKSRGKDRKVCATCDKARKRNNYQRKSVA